MKLYDESGDVVADVEIPTPPVVGDTLTLWDQRGDIGPPRHFWFTPAGRWTEGMPPISECRCDECEPSE